MYQIGNLYIPSQQSKQLLKINILFEVHNKDTRASISSLLSTWNSINFSLMFSLFFWTSIHMLWYIYTPPSIHLFKFNNSSTRAMCAICSELAKRPTPFWCRYFKFWTDFTYNSVVSVVDFEQLKCRLILYCPANIYLFKVNNGNSRKRFEICSKLIINHKKVVDVDLVFLLLTLNIFHLFF